MANNISILIKSLLDLNQKDVQTQIDRLSKKVSFNIKPKIDFSEDSLNKFKSELERLAKKIKVNLQVSVDQKSISDAEKAVQNAKDKIINKANSNNKGIKVFNKEQLEREKKDVENVFYNSKNVISSVKRSFESMGDVNVNVFKNAKNQITSLVAEVKKADGIIEKFKYDMANIKVGSSTQRGFVLNTSSLIDKNAGDNIQNALNKLQTYENKIAKLQQNFTSPRTGIQDINNLNALNQQYNTLKGTIDSLKSSNTNLSNEQRRSIIQQINNLELEIKKYRELEAVQKSNSSKLLNQKDIDAYVSKMNNAISRLQVGKDKVFSNDSVRQELSKLQSMLNGLNTSSTSSSIQAINGQFDNLRTRVSQVSNEFKNVNKDGYSFTEMIELAARKIVIWAISTQLIYGSLRKIKEGFNFIIEQSKVFTNLQMEMTDANLIFKDVTDTANQYANAMSTTTDTVMKAIGVFSTYTSTMDQVLEKSKAALILSNITGQGIEQTSDALMGTMAQYKLSADDAMHVADIITSTARMLSMDYPKGIQEISDGLRTVGSVARESGATIEELSAMIGTLTEKNRRSGNENANALRTIFGRILNVGEEADQDSMKKIEKDLDTIGVKIREIGDPSSLRPIGDIFKDLSEKWKVLTDVQKQDIAFQAAGMYRKNTFIALMENYGEVVKNTEAAINSEGVAMQKQEIFANSLQAAINNLKATLEELYLTSINSDFIKGFLQSANGLLSVFSNLSKTFGTLPVILVSVISALNLFGKFNFSKSILTSVQNFRVQLSLLRMEQTALSTQQTGLVVASSRLELIFQALTGKTIAQTAASVGLTVATTALNTALTFGLAMAITGIISAISSYVNRAKEAREEQKKFIADTKQHIQSLNEEVSQSKEYLKTLESSSSTTEQLVEARKALSELFPSIIIGYDNEGKAILANNESIKKQIALKEKQIEIEKKRLKDAAGYEILQIINEKRQLQNELERLNSKKTDLNNDLNDSSSLSPLEQEQAKQNPAIYKRRNEEIQKSIADIASKEAKLAQKILESNDKLRALYVSLMLDMTNFSEAQKKISEDYINTAIEGKYTQEKFVQGLQDTLNNQKLLQATEQELANEKKKTNVSTNQQTKSFEDLSKQVKETVNEVKDLNDIQSDLAKNNTLTADSLIDLITKYPELLDYIHQTKDGYIIEAQGLELVKQALVDKQIVALETESGISSIVKTELANRLKLYGIEIDSIKTLSDARKSALALMGKGSASINASNVKEFYDTSNVLESIAKINALKDMLKSGLTIPKVNTKEKGSDPEPIGIQELTSEFLKAYNALANQDEKLAESLEKQIKIADAEKDYNKQITLTNQLIDIRKKKIIDLEAANKKINADANRVRSETSYDTTKWFDKDGGVTETYLNLIKSFEGKTDSSSKRQLDNIKKVFNALSNLKQGYIANTQEIVKQNDLISEQKQKLSDIARDQIKTFEDAQSKITDLIKKYYDQQKEAAQKSHDEEEKRLEEKGKKYKEYIDDNIKQLERQRDAENYSDDIEEKLKEINELQSKINSLSSAAMSGDTEAQSKLEDYQKELNEKQSDLIKTQNDRTFELKKQAYQDDADEYEKYINGEKEKNDKHLNDYVTAIDKATSEVSLKMESVNAIMTNQVQLVSQTLQGEIYTITDSLANLFTATGENATTSSRLIEGEFLTSLTKVRDIYKEINSLYNIASGGNIKIPEVNKFTSGIMTPFSAVGNMIQTALKNLSIPSITSLLPNITTPTINQNIQAKQPLQVSFEKMLVVEGNITKESVPMVQKSLEQSTDAALNKLYNILNIKGHGN